MSKIKKKALKDELPGWCWTLMDSEMLVLVSWSLVLWSSSFSWSRLGGQLLQRLVFAWKLTEVSLAERTLSLSSLVVILCRKVHQEQLEESEMVPQYWSWVLDHLVAANRMSRLSQEKGVEDLKGWMHKISTSSSGITYSGSICCSRGPRAFLKTWVFHMFHQVSKPIGEEVKDKSAGIEMWRSSNML